MSAGGPGTELDHRGVVVQAELSEECYLDVGGSIFFVVIARDVVDVEILSSRIGALVEHPTRSEIS